MLFNYNYIILGRITKPEKATVTASRVLADSIPSVNKRIKKRNLLPLKLNYGSEVSGFQLNCRRCLCPSFSRRRTTAKRFRACFALEHK